MSFIKNGSVVFESLINKQTDRQTNINFYKYLDYNTQGFYIIDYNLKTLQNNLCLGDIVKFQITALLYSVIKKERKFSMIKNAQLASLKN